MTSSNSRKLCRLLNNRVPLARIVPVPARESSSIPHDPTNCPYCAGTWRMLPRQAERAPILEQPRRRSEPIKLCATQRWQQKQRSRRQGLLAAGIMFAGAAAVALIVWVIYG